MIALCCSVLVAFWLHLTCRLTQLGQHARVRILLPWLCSVCALNYAYSCIFNRKWALIVDCAILVFTCCITEQRTASLCLTPDVINQLARVRFWVDLILCFDFCNWLLCLVCCSLWSDWFFGDCSLYIWVEWHWVTSLFDLTFAEPVRLAKVWFKYLLKSKSKVISLSLACKIMVLVHT